METRVADVVVIRQHHAASFGHRFDGGLVAHLRHALIALTMVVGADVEKQVRLPVGPAYHLVRLSAAFRSVVAAVLVLLPHFYL